jgi:hypothetical protein
MSKKAGHHATADGAGAERVRDLGVRSRRGPARGGGV